MLNKNWRERVEIQCEIDGCNHTSNLQKHSALANIKRNGKFICMSCAQNGGLTLNLTDEEKSILLGSLLGDASISLGRTKQYRTALLNIEHSYKQSEYVEWKHNKLLRLATREPVKKVNNGYGSLNYRFDTKCHSCFYDIYKLTIKDGIKTVSSNWLDSINDPISLAVWYMDDGHIEKRSGSCGIATDGFTKAEVEMLVDWLKYKWQSDCHVALHNKKYYTIAFSWYGRDTFFDIIRPHIIESMRYKIDVPPRTLRKLDKLKISEAKKLREDGRSYEEIGEIAGTSRQCVSDAINGRTWKHLIQL